MTTSNQPRTIAPVVGFDFGTKTIRGAAVDFLLDGSSHRTLKEAGYTFRAPVDDFVACVVEANLTRLFLSAVEHMGLWTGAGGPKKQAFLRATCGTLADGSPGLIQFLLQAAMTARRRYRKRANMKWEEDEDACPAAAAADELCRHEAFLVGKGGAVR